ncbi:MAG: hypothetical protein FWG45_03445 [Oscillospiraceae bacterium]|nr:hypothetical protein [Oscillospiraceae bacterium]
MPVIPQISNPFQGKGYHTGLTNQGRSGSGEQFEIVQLTKPQGVTGSEQRDRDAAQRQLAHNREDLPQLMVKTPKDPTMAVETLKQLMSSDLLATAASNGYTELHGELEGLSKSIYLDVMNLVNEILNQENQTTMFSGNRLFDLLRGIANQAIAVNNEEAAGSIANFLKAVNFSFNRGEILNALAANMRFLSTYFSPSAALSEKLSELANAWASDRAHSDFATLKNDTVKLLHNVSGSLLNNEKTQILIPLIIHNLSRYNTSDYMLKDAFSAMLVHVPHSQKGAFMTSFEGFLDAVTQGAFKQVAHKGAFVPSTAADGVKSAAKPLVLESGLGKGSFPALYGEKLANGGSFPPPRMSQDSLADGLRGFLLGRLSGMDAVTMILSNLLEGATDAKLLMAMQADLAKIDSIAMLVSYLNDILKPLPDTPERQLLFEMLSETVSGMAEKNELPAESPPKAAQPGGEVLDKTAASIQDAQKEAQEILQSSTRATSPKAEIPQSPGEKIATQTPLPAEAGAKSALEELTSFIEKNINHTALKSLDSYNASNLLQSLINAPGVYTPLSHFVIPLQIGNARAFGELWVDNEDKNSGGRAANGGSNYHLFLTFEIESVGRFETDLYAQNADISLAVLYPESFAGEIDSLKERVSRIIASTDYKVKDFRTGVLRAPHDLTQIFPRIMDKRTGLDITI